eukprot:CAMPEP_0172590384 /NCGR_PEP_ID=MMETSP1068-20121228/8871_1 /TAXON_ID=35684 /ORGANISM="Pseudopedinella elastica, Strain CCMP716" /LENGTH=239 /DNA_ID=CAMNT_0013386231 /DNA_START=233 /DNA_END=949 /DNA_ORIENTATION=-
MALAKRPDLPLALVALAPCGAVSRSQGQGGGAGAVSGEAAACFTLQCALPSADPPPAAKRTHLVRALARPPGPAEDADRVPGSPWSQTATAGSTTAAASAAADLVALSGRAVEGVLSSSALGLEAMDAVARLAILKRMSVDCQGESFSLGESGLVTSACTGPSSRGVTHESEKLGARGGFATVGPTPWFLPGPGHLAWAARAVAAQRLGDLGDSFKAAGEDSGEDSAEGEAKGEAKGEA